MSDLRSFLTKRETVANARFSLFVPLSRLSSVVRFLSSTSVMYKVKQFVVKPCMKGGSVVSVLCSMPCGSDVDYSLDDIFSTAFRLRNVLSNLSLPESLDIELDDLPF